MNPSTVCTNKNNYKSFWMAMSDKTSLHESLHENTWLETHTEVVKAKAVP